jgi:toxin HigB-1
MRLHVLILNENREICVIRVVEVAVSVKKNLYKIPLPIKKKLFTWVAAVEEKGLNEVKKIPGYHDEPLKGDRQGQRSIRLNKQWRAIYRIINTKIKFVLIEEVTPHDY